jgi:ribonuclease HI
MSKTPELIIHTDGASRGNPGDAAFAYTIARDRADDIEEAGCLGRLTNNQAEYMALIRALEHAARLGREHRLIVHSDSELMVKQMRGEYKVKNEDLKDLFERARNLVGGFQGGVTFKHVRREQNRRTDELCNLALDGEHEPSSAADVILSSPVKGSLRDEALVLLREARAQPSAETVWDQLSALLQRHQIVLPSRSR